MYVEEQQTTNESEIWYSCQDVVNVALCKRVICIALFSHSESDRSQKERAREQQLMDELVAIIDQRNQIISSLDQDLQRCTDKKT